MIQLTRHRVTAYEGVFPKDGQEMTVRGDMYPNVYKLMLNI
jgi:hypothetical protein